jgi:hypothetical protein
MDTLICNKFAARDSICKMTCVNPLYLYYKLRDNKEKKQMIGLGTQRTGETTSLPLSTWLGAPMRCHPTLPGSSVPLATP